MNNDSVNLIVGAGLCGASIANLIASECDEKVILIDKKNHIAGNCYDYVDENGITVHKYGSHIFHTNNDRVWEFINRFTEFNSYLHEVIAVVDGKKTHLPFNLNTLYQVFDKNMAEKLEKKLLKNFEYGTKIPILDFQKHEDSDLKLLADYIYKKIFLNYTTKQWGLSPKEVDKTVTARVPVYLSKDDRYFQDKYQGIPVRGYTKVIEQMLNHPNIDVRLNTDFKDFKNGDYKRIFFTGSIDDFFDYKFGKLPYRSVKFEFEECDYEFYQPCGCVNYPNDYSFTRIHEFKHYLMEKSEKTVIAKEYSEDFESGKNERYYPVISGKNAELYKKYLNEAKKLKDVYFVGRLGEYRYYNMDEVIERALHITDEIFKSEAGAK